MRIVRLVSYIRSGEYGCDQSQYRAESQRVPVSLRVYIEFQTLAYVMSVLGAPCLLAGVMAVVVGPLTGGTVSASDALTVLSPGLSVLGVAALFWSVAVPFARQQADHEDDRSVHRCGRDTTTISVPTSTPIGFEIDRNG